MSEQDDLTPVDRLIGVGWRHPTRVLTDRAWATNPERDRLEKLRAERDDNGELIWCEWRLPDPDDLDFTVVWLFPVNAWDVSRKPERVGQWHRREVERELERVQALIDEYGDIT